MIQLIKPAEKYLWKFLDLYKFLAFLKRREIFFSRLDQFEDEMEACSEELAYWITEDLRIAEYIPSQRNQNINPKEYEGKGREFIIKLNSLKEIQKKICVSCFYAANEESIAMWKLYAGIQGIAIKFNSNELFKNLLTKYKQTLINEMELGGNHMNYINLTSNSHYDETANIKKLDQAFRPYNKDHSYKHENEYRFILINNDPNAELKSFGIKIDLKEKHFDFIISPDTENWKIELLNQLLLENGFNKMVKKSNIITKEVITKYKIEYLQNLLGTIKFKGRRFTAFY